MTSNRCQVITSQSQVTGTLKFNDALDILLSEEARKKLSGSVETSGSALGVKSERKLVNRD